MTTSSPRGIDQAYDYARERYGALGVDTEAALERLRQVSISLALLAGRRCRRL